MTWIHERIKEVTDNSEDFMVDISEAVGGKDREKVEAEGKEIWEEREDGVAADDDFAIPEKAIK